MEQFVVQGGKPLAGEIDVRGAKNAAFPALAAALLTEQDCVIANIPLIQDVYRMLELFQSMGAEVEWLGKRKVRVNTKKLNPAKINRKLVSRFRGSVVVLGPLLARFGKVRIPEPGGCSIGARPIDTHLDAFEQLGVRVRKEKDLLDLSLEKFPGPTEVVLQEFSVTTTENVLLFAALIPQTITLKIADQDYQVQELARILKKMGVHVSSPQSHTFVVRGERKLSGFRHELMYDPTEAGTFLLLAAVARGEVLVRNVEISYLTLFLKKLRQFGVLFEVRERKRGLADILVKPYKKLSIDRIQCFIYPGIHSDLQSMLGVLATQSPGSTLLHDPLYEGRLKYLEELTKMGAEVYIADPHRAIINGPTKLRGATLVTRDLRGGAALLMAALIAKGKSHIENVYQIDRGYEQLEERLRKLGADITRV